MQVFSLLGSALIVFMSTTVHLSSALDCGHPGTPSNGIAYPIKEIYKPGESVTFVCNSVYFILGSRERVCLSNGTWTGHIPICGLPLTSGHFDVSTRVFDQEFPPSHAIDGKPFTCARTPLAMPRWIRIDMNRTVEIAAVSLDMLYFGKVNLTVYVLRRRKDSDEMEYQKCATSDGILGEKSDIRPLMLACAGKVEGSEVLIQDNRNKSGVFYVCEVRIFERGYIGCGKAEHPAHSTAHYFVSGPEYRVEYACDHGYKLNRPGASNYSFGFRACLQDYGQWNGSQVSCQALDCGVPIPRNDSGEYIFLNGTTYGSVALLRCGTSETFITCRDDGTWSSPKLNCAEHMHTCPDLPVPTGGSVKYLLPEQRSAVHRARNKPRVASRAIGSSAIHEVGSIVEFKCKSRYYQLSGSRRRRCQETGNWSGRPSICLPVCGRSESSRSPFIINGNETDTGQWPWQVGIAQEDAEGNWSINCGASLINEILIITAAHCVTYEKTYIIKEPEEFRLYLGKYHRSHSKDDDYVQVRKVHEIYIHPDYDPGILDADIALIQLDSPVEFTYRVQPVCLPTEQTTRENLAEGKEGVVTGWGVNENASFSETLRQAVLPVVSRPNCERGYEEPGHRVTVTDYMFCAGHEEGRIDTCFGDSGGPFVFVDESSKSVRWVLEGIVSWGKGCARPKQYGVYTSVYAFLDWIHLFI